MAGYLVQEYYILFQARIIAAPASEYMGHCAARTEATSAGHAHVQQELTTDNTAADAFSTPPTCQSFDYGIT